MAREDLTARAARWVRVAEHAVDTPPRRWAAVGAGVALAVGLHGLTGDPRWAWLGAVPAVLGGVAGTATFGLLAAGAAAAGHAVVDVVTGLAGHEIAGVLLRTVALLGLGLTGAVLARLEQQRDRALIRSATEDPVTGLLDVRSFYDGLRELRRQGAAFAILLADVAGMRDLNERYGHPVGTEALRALGHVLRRSVKQRDLVARLGSDEVAIALVGADEQGAVAAARRLAAMLADERLLLDDGRSLDVHAYFGIACFPEDAEDEVDLLRVADHAVTDAKGIGPDEVAFCPGHPGPHAA